MFPKQMYCLNWVGTFLTTSIRKELDARLTQQARFMCPPPDCHFGPCCLSGTECSGKAVLTSQQFSEY